MNFELSDSVFAKASFKNVKSVNLWLGAHVMVEYSLEEARSVLEASLLNCETNLETMRKKLEQVKDSVTISEVRTPFACLDWCLQISGLCNILQQIKSACTLFRSALLESTTMT